MVTFRDPCACPACGVAAARTLTGAPAVAATLAAPLGDAGARVAGIAHPAGCGCCTRRSPVPNAIAAKGGRAFVSNGPVRWR